MRALWERLSRLLTAAAGLAKTGDAATISNEIHNEQTKLLANSLNSIATSAVTIGILAPIGAALFAPGSTHLRSVAIFGAIVYLLVALRLHMYAREILKDIRS